MHSKCIIMCVFYDHAYVNVFYDHAYVNVDAFAMMPCIDPTMARIVTSKQKMLSVCSAILIHSLGLNSSIHIANGK